MNETAIPSSITERVAVLKLMVYYSIPIKHRKRRSYVKSGLEYENIHERCVDFDDICDNRQTVGGGLSDSVPKPCRG